ncbi:4-alpha-glucanotransferase [Parapusillimonas sp. SGNA-6]|nr:4-alpha-glucanotransferase [Parapusillimonas sp. SGNA-6]
MTEAGRVDPALIALSEAAGLAPAWEDVHGVTHHVPEATLRQMLDALGLPCGSPASMRASLDALRAEQAQDGPLVVVEANDAPVVSYQGSLDYALTLEDGSRLTGKATHQAPGRVRLAPISQPGYHTAEFGSTRIRLAVCPARCPSVADLIGRRQCRAWGIAAQVYSLRASAGPTQGGAAATVAPAWAVGGDFGLVGRLAAHAARAGASAMAISPLHAMFAAAPERYSPYSPSSRLFLNAAYIEPSGVLGDAAVRRVLDGRDEVAARNGADSASRHVDWVGQLPERLALLRRLFDDFEGQGPAAAQRDFAGFRAAGGEALESHARYEALHAHHLPALGSEHGWRDWPVSLRDPGSESVRAFAREHERDVAFHVFLQWLADEGLRAAQRAARDAGMPIGLIADLAIGTDPRGSHAWSRQNEMLSRVSVGAPPDLYQALGQNWGLTAFSPRTLRQHGYSAFIETLRAALAHAGGVRIDHVLGLARMWVIAEGEAAADGVYLKYPLEDLLRLVALEAWRHRAIVVGENLGTVPAGFNDALERKGILGTNVLWFEREQEADEGEAPEVPARAAPFKLPDAWPAAAMATSTTHDLPTINGWWQGRDLQWRDRLGQYRDGELAQQLQARQADKAALWSALLASGHGPAAGTEASDAGMSGETGQDAGARDAGLPDAAPRKAVLAYVAATPCPLAIVPLEDLLGLEEQPNFPGGDGAHEAHPNWVQVLPLSVDEIFREVDVKESIAAVISARSAS